MPSPVPPDYRRAQDPRTRPRPGIRATAGVAAYRYEAPSGHRAATDRTVRPSGRYGAPVRYPDARPSTPRRGGPPAREIRRQQRQRMRRRRRRITVLALLVLVVTLGAGAGLVRGLGKGQDLVDLGSAGPGADNPAATPTDTPATTLQQAAGGEPSGAPATAAQTYTGPVTGPGTFGYASTKSPVLGTAGTLHRFRVAVEKGTGQNANGFAAAVVRTLGDKRSWIAGRNVRLQQVAGGSDYDFTLYLATPGTSEKMCLTGGLHTEKFTSCRIPGKVIVNLARWLTSVPGYGAPLAVYQQYAINHEVGHELGHGHEACPGPGRPAPVMQQQTYGLKGCVANAWPFVDGKRYSGMPIP